ncbi:MAG: hypothetical protein Q9M43_13950 [Sulfurimonas sp.]|nr:hypothetical protein [Sulfurimonas sp.]
MKNKPKKLDLEKIDSVLRGPQDEKTSHQIYRANRAAPREENV